MPSPCNLSSPIDNGSLTSATGGKQSEGIRPALQRAWRKVEEGMVGFVNVKTDYRARATIVRFSSRET